MRIGELCAGVGGLSRALLEVLPDAEVAWVSEIDPAACAVLDAHWPGVKNLGDLTVVDWSTVDPVDVLVAGYPCTPFSHAGKRKGASDDRHIWPYIADAVRVLRPRLVVLENVAGHLSLGFGRVLGDLAEAGYDARWCCLRASDVGACHRRERVFVLATDSAHVGRPRARGTRDGGTGPADGGVPAADTDQQGLEGGQPATGCDVPARRAVADPTSDGRGEGWAEPARVEGRSDAAERGHGATPDTDRITPGSGRDSGVMAGTSGEPGQPTWGGGLQRR